MFRQILLTQLKWTRTLLIASAVIVFATPALAWRAGFAATYGAAAAGSVMNGFSAVGPLLMLLACLFGFLFAAQPWSVEAAAQHVYPLSLPIRWSRYVAMRFSAGALTLLVPTFSLWLGSLFAVSLIALPPTLRAYPGLLAFRFLLGCLLIYALTFLLQYVAGRRSSVVILSLLVVGIVGALALSMTGNQFVLARIGSWLTDWPGPFAVFANDWKLIDV
jgi:hypothetical protein